MSQTSTGNLSDNCPQSVEVVQATTEAYLEQCGRQVGLGQDKSGFGDCRFRRERGWASGWLAGLVKLNAPRTYVSPVGATSQA